MAQLYYTESSQGRYGQTFVYTLPLKNFCSSLTAFSISIILSVLTKKKKSLVQFFFCTPLHDCVERFLTTFPVLDQCRIPRGRPLTPSHKICSLTISVVLVDIVSLCTYGAVAGISGRLEKEKKTHTIVFIFSG